MSSMVSGQTDPLRTGSSVSVPSGLVRRNASLVIVVLLRYHVARIIYTSIAEPRVIRPQNEVSV